MVDQFVLDRQPDGVTDGVLDDSIFEVRGVDQAGLGVAECELVVRFGEVRAVRQRLQDPFEVGDQVVLISEDQSSLRFAAFHFPPRRIQ